MHLLAEFLEMLLHSMDVRGDVIHHYVELGLFWLVLLLIFLVSFLFFFGLLLFLQVDEVGMAHPNNVLVMKLFVDLQFATLVGLVLPDFLHGDDLSRALHRAHKDFCESTDSALDLPSELVRLREVIWSWQPVVDVNTAMMIRLNISSILSSIIFI